MRRLPFLILFLWCAFASAQTPNLAIIHVTIINPAEAMSRPDMTVLIGNDKIIDVSPSAKLKLPAGIPTVDGTGKFLIPALWDMHVHTDNPARDFPMFVANGLLGVRNMGGVAKDVFLWREKTASGEMLGPQIVACGPLIDGPNPAHPEHTVVVRNATEGTQAVRSLKAMGADFIKVYDGVPRDAYFAIAAESKKIGLPFVGHVPLVIRVVEASNAGQRSLEHGAYLAGGSTFEEEAIRLEESGPNVMDEARRTGNFSLIPQSIADRGNAILDNVSHDRLANLYRAFVKNGTYLTPTLVVRHARVFVDDISRQADPRTRYVTKAEQEDWKPENNMFSKYRTRGYIAYQKREYTETLAGIRLAQQLGVQLLAGTDVVGPYTYPGFSLHDELGLLVEAGLKPLEALRTATANPARFLGLADQGGIAPGMKASLVLLDADPSLDISNTKKIFAVILHGKVLARNQLDELLNQSARIAAAT